MDMTRHEMHVRLNLLRVDIRQRWRLLKVLDAVEDLDFRMWCFGSSVHGTCTALSDVDLCIETHTNDEQEFYKYSDVIIAAYVDKMLENNAIDILHFNTLQNPLLRNVSVLQNGVLLKDFKEVVS